MDNNSYELHNPDGDHEHSGGPSASVSPHEHQAGPSSGPNPSGSSSHTVDGGVGAVAGKPAEAPSKRTMQNRKAQRDFRLRRANYVKDLEERVRRYEIDQFNNKVAMQNDRTELYRLRQENERLLDENQRLRTHIERVTGERLPAFLDPSPTFVSSHTSYLGGDSFGTNVVPQSSSNLSSHQPSSNMSSLDQHSRPSFGPSSVSSNVAVPTLPSGSNTMLGTTWDSNRRQSDAPSLQSRSMSDGESSQAAATPAPLSPLAAFADGTHDASSRVPRTSVWQSTMPASVPFGRSPIQPVGVASSGSARPAFGSADFMSASSTSNHARNPSVTTYNTASLASTVGRMGAPPSTSPLLYPLAGQSARQHQQEYPVISSSYSRPSTEQSSSHSVGSLPSQPPPRPPSANYKDRP